MVIVSLVQYNPRADSSGRPIADYPRSLAREQIDPRLWASVDPSEIFPEVVLTGQLHGVLSPGDMRVLRTILNNPSNEFIIPGVVTVGD